MLRPTLDQDQMFAGVVGLLSGIISAFAYMQVMALGRVGEPEARTVFYFAVGSAVAGALAMPLMGLSPWYWATRGLAAAGRRASRRSASGA